VWRESKLAEETEEEMLDRMEREEAEKDAMKDLEKKTVDAKTEMAVADALDDVRMRNAARERKDREGAAGPVMGKEDDHDEERERIEREIEEQARLAFLGGTGERVRRLGDDLLVDDEDEAVSRTDPTSASDRATMAPPPLPTFQRQAKKKKDFAAALGIKNGNAVATPVAPVAQTVTAKPAGPLVGYGSDSDEDD
jgi:hypothetical protein